MDFGLAAVGRGRRTSAPAHRRTWRRSSSSGREVTARSDIYALGLVLYEIFTGQRAYDAKTITELIDQQQSGTITTPTERRQEPRSRDRARRSSLSRPDPARRPRPRLAVVGGAAGRRSAGGRARGRRNAVAGNGRRRRRRKRDDDAGRGRRSGSRLPRPVWSPDGARRIARRCCPRAAHEAAAVLFDRAEELRHSLGYADAPSTGVRLLVRASYLGGRRNGKGDDPWRALGGGRPAALVFWVRTSPRDAGLARAAVDSR